MITDVDIENYFIHFVMESKLKSEKHAVYFKAKTKTGPHKGTFSNLKMSSTPASGTRLPEFRKSLH